MSFFMFQRNFKKSLDGMDSPYPLGRMFAAVFIVGGYSVLLESLLGIVMAAPQVILLTGWLAISILVWLPGELLCFNAKLEKYVNALYALLGLPVLVHVHYMLLTILFAPDIARLANFVLTVILLAGIALAIWGEEVK